MAAKFYVVIFALVLSILATAAFEAKFPKSYEPINPKDPKVVEIAKFAVAKYNKMFNKALVLLFVEKGEGKSSPTDGTIYALYIYTTSAAAGKEKYVTFVHDHPLTKTRYLVAFHWLPSDV
ncbi:hypothetical protein RD792_000823 [Penstemon davidsonii]|uniref:Cystatin domain-containing protein n=1 Tax=Penstemon davidsonii TaxID=160366 RepID=A0ABR0DMS2_9LAMI|nr:hypothetical protein RD792_000823 [Penstemon davidsonii]